MTLKEYLEINKKWLTKRWFANAIGITEYSFYQILNGNSMPSLIIGIRIVKYSKGQITYDGLIQPFVDKVRAKYLIPETTSNELIIEKHEALNTKDTATKNKALRLNQQ